MVNEETIKEALGNTGSDVELTTSDFTKPYKDIGLDSLDVFNLLTELELVTGKEISDEDFSELESLKDIIDHLNK